MNEQQTPGLSPTQPSPHRTPYHPPRTRKSEGWHNIASTVAILLLAPVIALFLTAFVFQSYQVDGPSMETTLSNNDCLIVWKANRTWARLTGGTYIPHRGDVIIFTEKALANYGQDPTKQLIKRVIGLPGERVTIKDGKVTVYNDEYPKGFQPDKTLEYGEAIGETPGTVDTVVPKGGLFVLGDNRSNSLDSSEFGSVRASNIVGKLILRMLPISNLKVF